MGEVTLVPDASACGEVCTQTAGTLPLLVQSVKAFSIVVCTGKRDERPFINASLIRSVDGCARHENQSENVLNNRTFLGTGVDNVPFGDHNTAALDPRVCVPVLPLTQTTTINSFPEWSDS